MRKTIANAPTAHDLTWRNPAAWMLGGAAALVTMQVAWFAFSRRRPME